MCNILLGWLPLKKYNHASELSNRLYVETLLQKKKQESDDGASVSIIVKYFNMPQLIIYNL